MTKKQFILIVFLWALVMALFTVPSRSAEIGIVQTQGSVTCQNAKKDLLAVGSRYIQLKKELEAEVDPSFQLVLKVQINAISLLGGRIIMWRTENCKDT